LRIPWDPRFAEEVARYDLRYTCKDCVYFLEDRGACAHEWPVADHLAHAEPGEPISTGQEIVFCKELEIA
jgi:hypothetical protein